MYRRWSAPRATRLLIAPAVSPLATSSAVVTNPYRAWGGKDFLPLRTGFLPTPGSSGA